VAQTELPEISLLQWSELEDEGIELGSGRGMRTMMWPMSEPF